MSPTRFLFGAPLRFARLCRPAWLRSGIYSGKDGSRITDPRDVCAHGAHTDRSRWFIDTSEAAGGFHARSIRPA